MQNFSQFGPVVCSGEGLGAKKWLGTCIDNEMAAGKRNVLKTKIAHCEKRKKDLVT